MIPSPFRASLAVVTIFFCACGKSPAPSPAPQPSAAVAEPVKVMVDDTGFHPSKITLEKGAPGRLTFLRTTDHTCATEVVFPELGITKPLPLDTPTTLDLPTGEARTLVFQCGMGMYKSAVVVR